MFYNNLMDINGLYFLIDEEYDCENSGCNSEGICRCSTIEGCTLESKSSFFIDTYTLADIYFASLSKPDQTDFNYYILERFLRYNVDRDSFETCAEGDYYGQILTGIYLREQYTLSKKFEELIKKSNVEKIHEILKMEYGDVSELVSKCNSFEVVTIDDVDEIHIPNLKHYNYAEENPYTDLNKPICLCVKIENRTVLIDGYHRFTRLNSVYGCGVPFKIILGKK